MNLNSDFSKIPDSCLPSIVAVSVINLTFVPFAKATKFKYLRFVLNLPTLGSLTSTSVSVSSPKISLILSNGLSVLIAIGLAAVGLVTIGVSNSNQQSSPLTGSR